MLVFAVNMVAVGLADFTETVIVVGFPKSSAPRVAAGAAKRRVAEAELGDLGDSAHVEAILATVPGRHRSELLLLVPTLFALQESGFGAHSMRGVAGRAGFGGKVTAAAALQARQPRADHVMVVLLLFPAVFLKQETSSYQLLIGTYLDRFRSTHLDQVGLRSGG